MSLEPENPNIPPQPTVNLGRGRWLRVILTLSKGSKLDQEIAAYIYRQITEPRP